MREITYLATVIAFFMAGPLGCPYGMALGVIAGLSLGVYTLSRGRVQ